MRMLASFYEVYELVYKFLIFQIFRGKSKVLSANNRKGILTQEQKGWLVNKYKF